MSSSHGRGRRGSGSGNGNGRHMNRSGIFDGRNSRETQRGRRRNVSASCCNTLLI